MSQAKKYRWTVKQGLVASLVSIGLMVSCLLSFSAGYNWGFNDGARREQHGQLWRLVFQNLQERDEYLYKYGRLKTTEEVFAELLRKMEEDRK